MIDYIEFVICSGEKVKPDILRSRTRKGEIVFARQLIMYFAVLKQVGSYTAIAGRYNRDHSTVNHAMIAVKNYIDTSKLIRQKVSEYAKVFAVLENVSIKADNIRELLDPLTKQLADIEQRYIQLNIAVSNLKNEIMNMEIGFAKAFAER